ncbi:MAG: DHH family phosphoesterase [Candidatus Hadarchaeales archaeon]
MYLMIGSDDFAFAIAESIRGKGTKVVVVERDETRTKHLKNLGYKEDEVFCGDPTSPEILSAAGISDADAVLVMLQDYSTTRKVLMRIKELREKSKAGVPIDPVVIARVPDEAYAGDAKWLGASEVLPENQLLSNSAMETFTRLKCMMNEKKLRRLIERERPRGGKMAIVLQTNPDPDSIASGVALKLYSKRFGIDADIIYDGIIGHLQNKALVNLLGVEMIEASRVNFNDYRWFALVDVATHSYCALPTSIIPTIIIDHHTVPESEIKGTFVDITPAAAASTLLANYLRFAGIDIDPPTATALLVGILTDTINLVRGFSSLDMEAYQFLSKFADMDMLRRLMSPSIPPENFEVLIAAHRASKIKEGFLFANVGEVKNRELIAFAADVLLNREGVGTTLVYGIVGDNIYVSARTKDVSIHLGNVLREAFREIGSAGGHPKMAGATIPLSAFKGRKERRVIDRELSTRFLVAAGIVKPKKKRRPAKKRITPLEASQKLTLFKLAEKAKTQ